jgi:DNA-binding NtrC family response regulator
VKVLVVDDHAIVRSLTSRLLASVGHAVVEAADPREAQAQLASGGVDLVLLDLRLGGSDSGVLAQWMEERQPGLRILFMSGDAAEVFAARDLCGPNRAFIQKPFSLGRLSQALDALMKPTADASAP